MRVVGKCAVPVSAVDTFARLVWKALLVPVPVLLVFRFSGSSSGSLSNLPARDLQSLQEAVCSPPDDAACFPPK